MWDFVSGLVAMGFLVAGLFFLKFWRRTADPLFALFALAFWVLAINEAIIAFAQLALEERTWLYLLRLVAFSLILVAILWKNRRA